MKKIQKTQETHAQKVTSNKQVLPYRVEIYQVWQRMHKDGDSKAMYAEMNKVSHGVIPHGSLQAFASHFKHGRKIPKNLPPVVEPKVKKVKQTIEERNQKQRERRAKARTAKIAEGQHEK
jgi:hypothetical protein